MLIINKDDLSRYRFAVAKVSFLKTYNEYELIEDLYKTNCFVLLNVEENKKYFVALLQKPNVKNITNENPIKIFYQKRYKKNDSNNCEILNKTFNDIFNRNLNVALYNASSFYEENKKYNQIIYKIFNNDLASKDNSIFLYKYYSNKIYENDKYNVIDGNVSFLNPKLFNDPFDCNCMNSYHMPISDMFRVLCTTNDYQNILMWSYYSNNHSGYCFKYNMRDIIAEILSLKKNGLCIIGKVDYKKERPSYRAKGKKSFSDLNFWINCTFSKYKKWNHEKEYRFVILSDEFNDSGDAFSIKIPIVAYYSGCKCPANASVLHESNGGSVSLL